MLASMAERKQPRMPLACKGTKKKRNVKEKGRNLSIPATSKEIAGNNLKAGCLKDLEVETTAMDGVRTDFAVGYGDMLRMHGVSLQGSLALERAVEHHIGIG